MNISVPNGTNMDDDEDDLTEDEVKYLAMKVKPKEIVIIICMLLLWLFSIHRYKNILRHPVESR